MQKLDVSELVWHIREHTIPAALSLLPGRMDTIEARAMILATGYQESEFRSRKQIVGPGVPPPAMGFWQFERKGGVTEILTSPNTKDLIIPICRMFLIEPKPDVVHPILAYHDVLACCFARLLLYRDPRSMPKREEPKLGWDIYLRNWRPGKPHPERWPDNYRDAWDVITA